MIDLAIIIVSWNVRQLLRTCLDSIYSSLSESARNGRELSGEIWVVDNDSTDGTPDMVRKNFTRVNLVANAENKGFAAANNQGMEITYIKQPNYILLLNPDTLVRERAIETLVSFMDQTPAAGMAGARLLYGDNSFQHSAFKFPGLAQLLIELYPAPARLYDSQVNGRYPRGWCVPGAPPFSIDHPLGASMIVRQNVLDTVGMMDTNYHMYCEEIDWAMRIKDKGWKIFCVPDAEIIHYGGQSTSQIKVESFLNLWQSRCRLYKKHYSPIKFQIASTLVRHAMMKRSKKENSPEIAQACVQVASFWQ
ncbi:MAG: glycosyltransferase family 2 protein [Anaerolineales bacterium]|nr:glycosyltransferase family 2 protein [Anaerolineales bacterium]